MANVILIAKAKAYQKSIGKVFGIDPELDIQKDKIRVYYPPDKLRKVQQKFKDSLKKESDIQVDWLPIITPHLLTNYAPYLLVALFLAYVAGSIKK